MAAKEPCHIGSTITVSGQISGNQDLIVEGRIEGRVGLDSRIVVEEAGAVEAEVDVQHADIKGALRGNLTCSKAVVLHAGARVVGNIRAPEITLEEGAVFQGDIEMDVDLPPDVEVAG